jgi:TetR/AcrR family transcriptional regulator, cholesterol catabolism regulator
MVQIAAGPAGPKALARKLEILRSASYAFGKHGYHETGMRDIASDLGMTVGNLYYYFENKQALLYFCQDETLNGLVDLAAWVGENAEGAAGRLYLLIVGHVMCINEGVPGSLAHHDVEALDDPWRSKIVRKRRRYELTLRTLIEDGICAGVFAKTDVKLAALAILGAANWTVKWFREEGGLGARAVGEGFAGQLVRGLLHPGACFEPPKVHVPVFGGL